MPLDFKSTQLAGITNIALVAVVKQGLVDGAPDITYLARLEFALSSLAAITMGSRESQPRSANPDDDFAGRMRIIHSFRFAILPPTPGAGDGRHRLLLNVTFDGGWEPYMRVIWRDLGTTLDFVFCHCEEYPLSHACTFETYIAWVRKFEVQGGYFYADSALSVADHRFLVNSYADQVMSSTSPPPGAPPSPALLDYATAALAPIELLHGLLPLFPSNGAGDDAVLLRFTHGILFAVRGHNITQAIQGPLRQAHSAALNWFEGPVVGQVPKTGGLAAVDKTKVQGGILDRYEAIRWGCLILLRVIEAKKAARGLHGFEVTRGADAHNAAKTTYRNIALTFEGLRALKVADERLAMFPQEFIEGMAARAGVLGDLRGNHPERWVLPERHSSGPAPSAETARVELSEVHVVVQLRRDEKPADAASAWQGELSVLLAPGGFEVLSVQEMARRPEADPALSREHFGFIDGASQPGIGARSGLNWSDDVPAGEILLGHQNARGDARVPANPDALLDNGSFLVVRKMRQEVTRLKAVAARLAAGVSLAPDDLLALMMGRTKNGDLLPGQAGTPPNDFDFKSDPLGALCPIQSHVRRANPRDGALPVPRIVRRGMSYGPTEEEDPAAPRGVVFMAYNASIAEQFETIQRWIAGSTPSGGLSTQSDPFLGVPDPGHPRPFGLEHGGKLIHVDLGPDPFTVLEWGLYLFAPSTDGLAELSGLAAAGKA